MHKPWLLVLSGPPCSGKSRLAARLTQATGLPCLAKDAFKEALFDRLGTGDAPWSARLSRAAFDAQFVAAAAIIAAGGGVILEGNFRREHTPRVGDLVARGAHALQVACRADSQLLERRHAERGRQDSRHPGHLDAATRWDAALVARHAPLDIKPTVVFDSGVAGSYAGLLDALAAAGVPVSRRHAD